MLTLYPSSIIFRLIQSQQCLLKKWWDRIEFLGLSSRTKTRSLWVTSGKSYFILQESQLRRSTAYHLQTNGLMKVVNRCLKTYLWCFSSGNPKTCVEWIFWAGYWNNTTYRSSIATAPFKAVYGRDPLPLLRYELNSTGNATVEQLLSKSEIQFLMPSNLI